RAGTRLAELSGVSRGSEMTSARTVTWAHRNRREQWTFRDPVTLAPAAHADRCHVWSTAGDVPLIIAADVDRSVVARVVAHPTEWREADPAGTALLKRLLTHGTPGAMAWLDWSRTLLLRMDDPGGAQNVYSRDWSYPKIGPAGWTEIGRALASRNARM